MSGHHAAPGAPGAAAGVIEVAHHEVPVIEISTSVKRAIPVLLIESEGTALPTMPMLPRGHRARLVLHDDDDDETDLKTKRKKWLKEMRGWLMVLATLAASVTYQAGLNPPGGFDNDGNPVLQKVIKRYLTFYYFNATAFVTSLVIIILLLNEHFYYKEHKIVALVVTTFLDLVSLMGAYIAGSTRDVLSSIYVIVLAGFVFIYVVNIARILPNLCFIALYVMPCLYALADKGWLPVTPAMKEKVRVAKQRDTARGIQGDMEGGAK